MRCQTARKWITRHLAGELTPGRTERLERHVERCEGCRREQVAYAALDRALDILPLAAAVPARLEQDTLRRVRLAAAEDPPAPRRLWDWLRFVVPALAGAAALVFAVRLTAPPSSPSDTRAADTRGARLADPARAAAPRHAEPPAAQRDSRPAQPAPRRQREKAVPSEPPAELAARPDLFVNLPLLRNMEKLKHFDAIQTTTLDGQSGESVERMNAGIGATVMAVLLAASPAAAQWYARDWQQLSPEEQRRAWENYRRYQQLPEQRRQQYENRYQRFQTLPPQEQEQLRQNYESYRRQDPATREQFNEKYRRWKQRGSDPATGGS